MVPHADVRMFRNPKEEIHLYPSTCLHQAKESWEMNLNEKLELATEIKYKGNQYFKVCCFCSKLEKC